MSRGLLLASAVIAVYLLHARTLGYGFDYDDYHFVHPYSRAEIAEAFTGPWDASGIELPYYRPLTIALFAARFDLMGVNAAACHALSLILFTCAAFLAGWVAYRAAASAAGGLAAILFFVTHPAMPYSLVAWITNQMHLFEVLIVLTAMCWWHAVRRRPAAWWTPLLPLAIAAFLVKEDGIMLLPSIAVVHTVHRRLAEPDLPRVRWPFLLMSAFTLVALVVVRNAALHGTSARPMPGLPAALHNYWIGLDRVFRLAPADRPWQPAASWFVIAVLVFGLVSWRHAAPRSRALMVNGVCIALLFNLPFVFVTKPEQMHLVALGAVFALAGGLLSIVDAARSRAARTTVLAATAGGIVALATVTIDITRDFEPFGPAVLSHDRIVEGWAAVPIELRDYLARKREPGAGQRLSANPADTLETVTFGVHGTEAGRDGVAYRWMAGPRTVILIARGARSVVVPLRHAIEIFREPVHASIEADGRIVDQMDLRTPEWRGSETAVGLMRPPWFTGMHRIVIRIDRVWKPSEILPGSSDDRVLGLQVGTIGVRSGASVTPAGARR